MIDYMDLKFRKLSYPLISPNLYHIINYQNL